MNKVYRLLRNNIESGPFTIDELLGQQLNPTDMLWVEGQSTAWCYLSEIELKPSVENIQDKLSDQPKKIKKSSPKMLDERADEIRRKVMAYQPRPLPVIEEVVARDEKHIYIPLDEKDTIELVDHRRQKSTMLNDVLMTAVIVVLFAGGLYGGQAMFAPENKTVASAERVNANSQHAAKANIIADSAEITTSLQAQQEAPQHNTDSSQFLQNTIKPNASPSQLQLSAPALSEEIISEPALPESTYTQKATAILEEKEKPKETENVKESKPKEIQKDTNNTKAKESELKPENEKDNESLKSKEEKKGFFKKLFGKKKKEETAEDKE